jgi:hypothetical protein
MVHEFTILAPLDEEWFFVLAIFGHELVISYEGPEVSGYRKWLAAHNYASPLYPELPATEVLRSDNRSGLFLRPNDRVEVYTHRVSPRQSGNRGGSREP